MKRDRKCVIFLTWAVVLLSSGWAFAHGSDMQASADPAGKLALVVDGTNAIPIVVFEDTPPMTRAAADELAAYIEKITGARPDVIEGCPVPVPKHAIWVGVQPVLDELFPGTDFEFRHPEEILLAANKDYLVIAGRDRWNPDHMRVEGDSYKGRGAGLDGVQQEYGTANAVYTFLQDGLDVRWLWPGELGEDVIKQKTIAFEPFEYRYHPQFRGRADMLRFSSLWGWRGVSHDWCRFQRMQLDSLSFPGGHPFSKWWDRFHETNPEYFALQPDGTRGGGDKPYPSARCVKLCLSNPAVWAQWLRDAEVALKQNPNRLTFGAGENDSGGSGYCVCTNCQAWDDPNGELVGFGWRGLGMKYVTMADRQVTFANTLARMLKARFPDKDLYVVGQAYGNSRPPPAKAVPDDNVIFSVVANIHNRPPGNHRQLIEGWGQVVPHLGWRPNLGYGAGWSHGFPNIAPQRVIDDMRFAADHNVIAMFFDTVWEHWANQGPHYYMFAQMAWNPYADGEAILVDYYRRAFGPAAAAMTAYWTLMDEASDEILFDGKVPQEAWNADFYRQAYGYLAQAAAEVAGAPEVYGRRIEFVRAGLDYLRLYYENRALIAGLKKSVSQDTGALEEARSNWREIVRILEEYPRGFNPSYVSVDRRNSRARSANPDHQLETVKKDEARPGYE